MAQINFKNIEKIEKNKNIIHDKVYTTYTVFEHNGERYVQLDTYGKDDRKLPDKISQSIQIDRETARFLAKLLIT